MILRRLFLGLLSALPFVRAFRLAHGAPQAPIASNIRNARAWAAGTFRVGQRCTNAGQAYECTSAGTSTAAPTGTGNAVNNGGSATFKWSSAVDFTSLNTWAAAHAGTLTSPIRAALWNDQPGTAWGVALVSGIKSNVTNDVTITAAAGESFADHPGPLGEPNASNGVVLAQSNPAAMSADSLEVHTDFLTVTRIQTLNNSRDGTRGHGLNAYIGAGGILNVQNNILSCNPFHEAAGLGAQGAPGQITVIAENNVLVWPATGPGSEHRALSGGHFGSASRVEQNTMIVPSNLGGAPHDFAIGAAYIDAITIRNNAIFGFGNDYGYPNYAKAQPSPHFA